MKIIKCENYQEMSEKALEVIQELLKDVEKPVLGLATGSTPEGLYQEMIKANEKGEMDFSDICSVNLDEYVGIDPENEQSYHYYMKDHLFDHVNIKEENYNIPKADGDDLDKAVEEYNQLLDEIGRRNVQILGIGNNGHIAFNEPDKTLSIGTRIVQLTDDTIEANSRFFDSPEEVPKKAISMGIGDILNADHIVLLANGKGKQKAIHQLIHTEELDPMFPASFLKVHPSVFIIADKEALA
ncbi:MAG: glucosamine-6-phosphate deaminase [Tissierellia bacterium]|nr:glucosamine-6-phosphate deaminase [Tissierellia bacterium]